MGSSRSILHACSHLTDIFSLACIINQIIYYHSPGSEPERHHRDHERLGHHDTSYNSERTSDSEQLEEVGEVVDIGGSTVLVIVKGVGLHCALVRALGFETQTVFVPARGSENVERR